MTEDPKVTRLELLRQISGEDMQTMKPIPGDMTKVRCFCCEQTLGIREAGNRFYEDFKGALKCDVCDKRKPLESAEELTRYFSAGFPECCGVTMTWLTQYELEKELP